REGLLVAVRSGIARARRQGVPVRESGLRVRGDAGREVAIEIIPIAGHTPQEDCILVLFEWASGPSKVRRRPPERRKSEVERLEQELAATREYLQAVIEQQEAANEELQSANEEVQSANEELQSINEELETSKEEIQSSNEELAT